jgi:hypothetical protein
MKQFSIVGQKHRGLDPYLAGTLPGVPVTLVRDPKNKYDPNAVMVWIDGKHVGYIPSKTNAALAAFMDSRPKVGVPPLALDEKISPEAREEISGRAMLSATFIRSPNSGYPMCEISE